MLLQVCKHPPGYSTLEAWSNLTAFNSSGKTEPEPKINVFINLLDFTYAGSVKVCTVLKAFHAGAGI